MTEHLCACSRPSPDAELCAHCGHLLRKTLGEISEYHGLGWDLDLALSRQVRIERPTGKAEPDPELRQPGTLRPTPSPYDHAASVAARALHNTLATWCRFIDEHLTPRPAGPFCHRCAHGSCQLIRDRDLPDDTITSIARWLIPRAGWLRHHPAGAEALDEIQDAVRAARRAVDRPADRLYAGPCQECGIDLYARVDAAFVTCPACEESWSVGELREWLLDSAQDVLATATEISRALTRYASPVTPSAIRGYVHRGRLVPHGERMEGGRAIPLYRLGDVTAILQQQMTARNEKATA